MQIAEISRENIERQIAQNMIEARIILPDQCPHFINLLKDKNGHELIIALLKSWQVRERALDPISFYPVNLENISLNRGGIRDGE